MDKHYKPSSRYDTRDSLNFSRLSYELDSDDEDRLFHSNPAPFEDKAGSASKDRLGYAKRKAFGVDLIYEMDKKMKEHVDKLLHAFECLAARVSQLDSKTQKLEDAVDDLKEYVTYSHGKAEAKLANLGNILTEVQGGIQDLRDKQEISEVRLQLQNLLVSKGGKQSENPNRNVQDTSPEASVCFPQLPHQVPTPVYSYPSPIITPATSRQYAMPPNQQIQPPPSAFYHFHQAAPQPPLQQQSSQPTFQDPRPQPHQLHQHNISDTPQNDRPVSYNPNKIAYMPSQGNFRSSQIQPPENFCYDRPHASYRFSNYPSDASTTSYGGSTIKTTQLPSSPSAGCSGNGQLPTAKTLPHALPTASFVDSESSSKNKSPFEETVDKVVAMGFRRDTVRGVMKKLAADGQSMDLNVVVDKLMNSL